MLAFWAGNMAGDLLDSAYPSTLVVEISGISEGACTSSARTWPVREGVTYSVGQYLNNSHSEQTDKLSDSFERAQCSQYPRNGILVGDQRIWRYSMTSGN